MIHRIVMGSYAVSIVSLLVMLAIPRTRRHMVRKAVEMYAVLPGPHWLRILIVVVAVGVTQLIPGNLDDWALFVLVAAWLKLMRSRRGRGEPPTSACGHSQPARSAGAGTLPNADRLAQAEYLALIARGL